MYARFLLWARTLGGADLEVDGMGIHCHVGQVDSEVESEECARLG